MSRTYKLKIGDDYRELAITLTRNRQSLEAQPTSAIIRIKGNGTVHTRTLTLSAGKWRYRFTDDDWADFPAGSYTAEVYATMSDGTNLTFPTSGTLTVVFESALVAP